MFTYNDENELLSIEQVCEKLLISHTTAYKLLQSGEIKAFKLGTWKIPAKSVYEYINKKDKARKAYQKYFAGTILGENNQYDICLNSSKLGYENCVKVIKNLL